MKAINHKQEEKKVVKKKILKKDLTAIKKLVVKLVKLMAIEEATTEVVLDKEQMININLNCPNPGILIGFRGETIFNLQIIISLIIYKKFGSWQKVIVNVADWRQQREASLKQMALNAVQKVKFSGEEIVLNNLNALERRIIHLILADNAEVYTESEGEGRDRKLIIKLKKDKK